MKPRRVDVLFSEGCPHHEPTVRLIQDVAADLGLDIQLREIAVDRREEATRLRFLGSPTVQVDGIDIDPTRTDQEAFLLGCRLYGGSGIPPRDMIASALAL